VPRPGTRVLSAALAAPGRLGLGCGSRAHLPCGNTPARIATPSCAGE
jgi:hypothetical protein